MNNFDTYQKHNIEQIQEVDNKEDSLYIEDLLSDITSTRDKCLSKLSVLDAEAEKYEGSVDYVVTLMRLNNMLTLLNRCLEVK